METECRGGWREKKGVILSLRVAAIFSLAVLAEASPMPALAADPPVPITPVAAAASPVAVVTPAPLASLYTPHNTADILAGAGDSLFFVEGEDAKASGFVANLHGKKYALSNIHAYAGNPNPRLTLLDSKAMELGAASAAVGHDIMAIAIKSGGTPMECADAVDKVAKIGDDVVVLGNEEGADVVHPIEGKIVGIGPNLVEVDADFKPGNSGSPIIHKASGKIIGVATYVVMRQITPTAAVDRQSRVETKRKKKHDGDDDDNNGGDNLQGPVQVRHFGYRLDSIEQWQPVNWRVFAADAAAMEKIKSLTADLIDVIHDVDVHHGRITAAAHQSPAIAAGVQALSDAQHSKSISQADYTDVVRGFLLTLRTASQADNVIGSRLTYDYFKREFTDEQRTRDELYKQFDQAFSNVSK